MSEAPFALSTIPPQPVAAEGDFDAICETVKASERGRWFLEEYARRNRNADTAQVLAAIGRIEGVVRDSRDREAYQSVRADLLDMARTIAVTRADVAESKVEAAPEVKSESEPPAAAGSDVFAMAERIQDVAWTMRERGLDPRTCEQIEALAGTILSATSLRNPNDQRTRKLGEVLHYLERRIEGMLDAVATEAAARQTHADAPAEAPAEAPVEPAVETAADDTGPEAVNESPPAESAEPATAPEPATVVSEAAAPEMVAAPVAASDATPAESVDFLREPLPPPLASPPAEAAIVVPEPVPDVAAPAPSAGAGEPTAATLPVGQVLPVVRPMPRPPAGELLLALEAMSEAERVALFT
jgi:hypothetical protein